MRVWLCRCLYGVALRARLRVRHAHTLHCACVQMPGTLYARRRRAPGPPQSRRRRSTSATASAAGPSSPFCIPWRGPGCGGRGRRGRRRGVCCARPAITPRARGRGGARPALRPLWARACRGCGRSPPAHEQEAVDKQQRVDGHLQRRRPGAVRRGLHIADPGHGVWSAENIHFICYPNGYEGLAFRVLGLTRGVCCGRWWSELLNLHGIWGEMGLLEV